MATSGTVKTNVMGGGYYLAVAWEVADQDIAANSSTVKAIVRLGSNDAAHNIESSASKTVKLTINGATYSTTAAIGNLAGGASKDLFAKTVTVKHGTDGKKTIDLAASVAAALTISGTYYGTIAVSGSGTLPAIPRASAPTAVKGTIGAAVTVTTNRASSGFTHKLTYAFGGASGTIATDVGASCSWTPPESLADEIPKAVSGTGTVTCKTYSGDTLLGTTTAPLTLSVPSSAKPTATVALSDTTGLLGKLGAYIKGRSVLRVKTTAAGAMGSSIVKTAAEFGGATVAGTDVTFDAKAAGTQTVKVTVTDSRGRTGTASKDVEVAAYTAPKLTSLKVQRVNASGAADESSDRVKVTFKYSASAVGSNKATAALRYRKTGSTAAYTSVSVFAAQTTLSGTATAYLTGLSADNSYELLADFGDLVETTTAAAVVPTQFQLINFAAGGQALAFGGVAERSKGAEFKMKAYLDAGAELLGQALGTAANKSAPGTSGTNWTRIGNVLVCAVTVSVPGGSGAVTSKSFTWPAPFAAEPYVAVGLSSTVPGKTVQGASVAGVTATGGTVYVLRTNTTASSVELLAFGVAG